MAQFLCYVLETIFSHLVLNYTYTYLKTSKQSLSVCMLLSLVMLTSLIFRASAENEAIKLFKHYAFDSQYSINLVSTR